jgi:thioredoxin-like negative regulator of GroEL
MSTANVIEIDNIESWVTNVEQSSTPIFVMFYSPNCPHCQIMAPYVQSYAQEFKGKITFVQVNIRDHLAIASKYGILGTPTFTLFCKGRALRNYVGEMYPSLIKKMIEDALQNSVDCVDKATWIYPSINGYS